MNQSIQLNEPASCAVKFIAPSELTIVEASKAVKPDREDCSHSCAAKHQAHDTTTAGPRRAGRHPVDEPCQNGNAWKQRIFVENNVMSNIVFMVVGVGFKPAAFRL